MAGIDYVCCAECGKRLFYDGDERARDEMTGRKATRGVTCNHCVSKLKKKIDMKKFIEKYFND